ncbi:TetR/AcrR family transcriptional regulator [Nocardia amikacinitolerans]|uniref:TetR/AcrR family transcriptional regulator n=1 Tax=Nocardia amikacinitolerans TaxID=756689 RepID=UPI0020A40FB2|nr:TetR/AcrR family transcriptional regulator [Nocardia amikacinitolerans]MCP2277399.1 transcriptional regulator, TetR family [Nocardia amikacinitolerans]MCP2300129.1 transcriptional regulator, TetR family [Nocardia amikacinitolerans]
MHSRREVDQARPKRVDARTERWRAHRVKVRDEFVDAAFRALDKFGPEVSMGDIAKEAGAAKPKLYRHFEDKTDLYNAIVDRVRDMLWERIISSIDLSNDSARELVRRGAAEYALVVTEHPNVFRFMLHSHFTQQADESERALQSARQSARRAAEMFAGLVEDESIDVASIELVNYSIFGAVASATDWWLGANRLQGNAMPIEKFVAYIAEIVSALAEANARLNGIVINADLPLHSAFSTT